MLRGLNENWKQCIGYYVGTVKSHVLPDLLRRSITKIQKSGFSLKAVTSDQGSINRSTFKKLGATVDKPTIEINNIKIVCMFDVPHLIKSVRNCLMSNDIIIGEDRISWSIILKVAKIDDVLIKGMHNLTDKHVAIDNSFGKLSVKAATQVFSNNVAAGINACIALNYFPNPVEKKIAVSTADFLSKINTMFDNLNSQTQFSSNPNKSAISDQTPHVIENLKNMKIWIEKWIHLGKMQRPFCFDGLIQTINGVLEIWEREKNDNEQKYIITSHFNQDPTENLISMLRNNRGSYEANPSAMRISRNLKQICFQNAFPTSETSYAVSTAHVLIDPPTNSSNSNEIATDLETDNIEMDIAEMLSQKNNIIQGIYIYNSYL